MSEKKTLVTYFSCSGVTAQAAKKLAETIGADLFEIEPKQKYSNADLDWMNKQSRTSVEMKDETCRPEIAHNVADMDAYEVVYIGFPIWWYVEPKIIDTFLESYDLTGKTMVPFATSGGSGFGNSEKQMKELASAGAVWKKGMMLNGRISQEAILAWTKQNEA